MNSAFLAGNCFSSERIYAPILRSYGVCKLRLLLLLQPHHIIHSCLWAREPFKSPELSTKHPVSQLEPPRAVFRRSVAWLLARYPRVEYTYIHIYTKTTLVQQRHPQNAHPVFSVHIHTLTHSTQSWILHVWTLCSVECVWVCVLRPLCIRFKVGEWEFLLEYRIWVWSFSYANIGEFCVTYTKTHPITPLCSIYKILAWCLCVCLCVSICVVLLVVSKCDQQGNIQNKISSN